jgi:chromosome segregation ATPase
MALQRRQVTELQVRLQEELESGQHKCAIQKVEINNLRNMISALERVRSGHGATQEEVSDMQGVLEAWQAQATSAQAELLTMSEKLKVVAEQRSREKKRRQQLQCELDSLRIADGGADKATTTDVQEQEVGLKRQLITAESTIRQLGLELRTERRDAQALATDLQAKLRSLGGTLSERTNQCIAHSDAVQRLKVEIREKDVALQKVMMEWTHMHARLATAVSETERVQGHLERIEPEHRSLRKNLRRIQGKMTAMELGTQALLQTKMHAIAQKHEECEALRATLVASRSEATKSKISKEIHAMRASQLESAIVEVHEKNGSYEANDHVLRANNMTLVKQLHAAEEACRGIVGSKKETAVALQEAQNAQRVSEQRTHSVQEEALASVAYLQVQLEKVKSARALLASTACKNQQIMLQAHKTELVANETKNKRHS